MIPRITGSTVDVFRGDRTDDAYDTTTTLTPVIAGLTCEITGPSGTVTLIGGQRVEDTWVFNSDPADIQAGDRMVDENDQHYTVVFAQQRVGLGLDHTTGRLRQIEGAF